jgi:hypothetical protein
MPEDSTPNNSQRSIDSSTGLPTDFEMTPEQKLAQIEAILDLAEIRELSRRRAEGPSQRRSPSEDSR